MDQKRFFATQPKNPPKQHLRYIHRVKPAESIEEEQSVEDGMHPSSVRLFIHPSFLLPEAWNVSDNGFQRLQSVHLLIVLV